MATGSVSDGSFRLSEKEVVDALRDAIFCARTAKPERGAEFAFALGYATGVILGDAAEEEDE